MSGRSKLEDDLAFAIKVAGLPEPVREYRFAWCCQHLAKAHWYVGRERRVCKGCEPLGLAASHHLLAHDRNWRADFAWPERRILAECEGGAFTGGRHVRGRGFEADIEKYNAAELAGWVVLRFTQRQITSGEALNQIERALKEAA